MWWASTIFTTTSVAAVTACTNTQMNSYASAKDVINKIHNKNLNIPDSINNTIDPSNIQQLKKILQTNNNFYDSRLTDSDLATLSFQAMNFSQQGVITYPVKITSHLNYTSKSAVLQITILNPAQTLLQKIEQINIKGFIIPSLNINDPTTIVALKYALKLSNPTLTNFDLQKITLSGVLTFAKKSNVVLTATVEGTTATKNVIFISDNGVHLLQRIINKNLTIIPVNLSTGNPNIQTQIFNNLLLLNLELHKSELRVLSIATKELNPDGKTATDVLVTISIPEPVGGFNIINIATFNLKILTETPQSLNNKIDNIHITIASPPAQSDPTKVIADDDVTSRNIKTELKKNNPNLSDDDLQLLNFSATTLIANKTTNVNMEVVITDSEGEVVKTKIKAILKVTLESTEDIFKKLQHLAYTNYVAISKGATSDKDTITALKNYLTMTIKLTNSELSTLSFQSVSLSTTPTLVTITINNSKKEQETVEFLSTELGAIKDKIKNTVINVPFDTDPALSNSNTLQTILQTLQTHNSNLTQNELNLMSVTDDSQKIPVAGASGLLINMTITSLGLSINFNITVSKIF